MTLTNELLIDISKAAVPNAESDLVAVNLFSQQIYKLTIQAQGHYFYEISELYIKLLDLKKFMRDERAKLYTVSVN